MYRHEAQEDRESLSPPWGKKYIYITYISVIYIIIYVILYNICYILYMLIYNNICYICNIYYILYNIYNI